MATGIVDYNSDLVRKKWMREGLVQAASTSFWNPMTGNNTSAIVYQENNENSGAGHTVVFDFKGNLSGKGVKGKETARGKGEQKKKFSDKITVERYRLIVDNGDKFDGVNIGDLSINEHSESRSMLGDLFTRFKDQAIFDAGQGNLITNEDGKQAASHSIDLGSTFNFNTLVDIERNIRTSQGFTVGGVRRPLVPYRTDGNRPMWLYVIDSAMASMLRKDTQGYQTLVAQGDVRGNNNRNIDGVIGRLGSLIIVEADNFFGATSGTADSGWQMNDSEIELSGMRQFDSVNKAWTGQEGFDYDSTIRSRGMLLGAGAFQLAFGKMPDYKYKSSDDFDIDSESALEVWMEARKTHLKAENADYKQAKVANIDHGVIVTDLTVS